MAVSAEQDSKLEGGGAPVGAIVEARGVEKPYGVTLLTTLLPARRASRVYPAEALHYQ